MLPYTSKFYANGTIFDSVGNIREKYISTYSDGDAIYFLKDTTGFVNRYDTHTETIDIVAANRANEASVHSVVVKNGDVYCFEGHDAVPFDNDTVLYVLDDNQLVQERYDFTSKVVVLSSTSQIRDFVITPDNGYIVLHGTQNLTKFSRTRLTEYTLKLDASLPTLTGIMDLSASPEFIAVDYTREYTSSGVSEYPIVLGKINTGQMFLAKINTTNASLYGAKMIDVYGSYHDRASNHRANYNLTNYSYLSRKYSNQNNSLLFKLTLKNVYNNRDVHDVEIPVDLTTYTSGYHHFVFRINTIQGVVSLFVDGREYQSVQIPSADFTFQDITYESMCVGATYFANNIPLFEKLKQPNYYMVDNCKIKQFKIYDKAVTNDEIRLLTYKNTDIQDLVASLPCGQRNEIEQIERIFSFNVPGSKSNSVNIVIKNSDINDAGIQARVKAAVMDRLQKVLPATTHINEIVFKNSKPVFNVRS